MKKSTKCFVTILLIWITIGFITAYLHDTTNSFMWTHATTTSITTIGIFLSIYTDIYFKG